VWGDLVQAESLRIVLDHMPNNALRHAITPTTCSNPDAHFFYHEGHPSTAAHRAVGELLYREAITKAP